MNIIKAIRIFYKYAQSQPVATPESTESSESVDTNEATEKPKIIYNRSIRPLITDINMAITDLNAAKSLMTDTFAISCATKIVNYFLWYRTIGAGGNPASVGKHNLIPTFIEYNKLIQTGLFGENFIISLAALLDLTEYIPQFKIELSNLEKTK